MAYHLSLIEDFIGFEDEQSAFLFNAVFFYSEHESNGGALILLTAPLMTIVAPN